jgi:hypothetical protein
VHSVIGLTLMKKLKGLKDLHNEFVDVINQLDEKLQDNLKKIKKEYQRNVTEEKVKLLIAICNGEGLDFDQIKGKYLKAKELSQTNYDPHIPEEAPVEEDLLDKVEINGKEYYYENKEKGIVYDMSSKPVGIFKGGKILFV